MDDSQKLQWEKLAKMLGGQPTVVDRFVEEGDREFGRVDDLQNRAYLHGDREALKELSDKYAEAAPIAGEMKLVPRPAFFSLDKEILKRRMGRLADGGEFEKRLPNSEIKETDAIKKINDLAESRRNIDRKSDGYGFETKQAQESADLYDSTANKAKYNEADRIRNEARAGNLSKKEYDEMLQALKQTSDDYTRRGVTQKHYDYFKDLNYLLNKKNK